MSSRRRTDFRKLNSPALSLWTVYCLLKQLVDVSFSQGSVFPQTFFSNLVYLFFSFLSKGFWVWQRLTIFRYTWLRECTFPHTVPEHCSFRNKTIVTSVTWRLERKRRPVILNLSLLTANELFIEIDFVIFLICISILFFKSLWCTFKKVLKYLLAFE